MPKLNIPLNRNKTARPPRRAVWKLLIYVIIFFGLCCLINLTLNHDYLANAAGNNNKYEIYFDFNKQNLAEYSKYFGAYPIIPNRPITLDHIQPFLKGDLAILSNGDTRYIAFKGNPDSETISSWQSYGLTAENQNDIWIIHDQNKEVDLASTNNTGVLKIKPKLSKGKVTLNLGQLLVENMKDHVIQNNTLLYLNIPQNLITTLGFPDVNAGGTIKITQTNINTVELTLELDQPMPEEDLFKTHKSILGQYYANTQLKELDDGTKIKELTMNQDEPEKTQLGNTVIYSSKNISSSTDSEKTKFTLAQTITSETTAPEYTCSTNPLLYIKTNETLNFLNQSSQHHLMNNQLSQIFGLFVQASLDKDNKTLQFTGCFY